MPVPSTRRVAPLALLVALCVSLSCGSDSGPQTPAATLTATAPAATASQTPAPDRETAGPPATATTPPPPATETLTQQPEQPEPAGFPIDPKTRLGVVVGEPGERTVDWGAGVTAGEYSRDAQPSSDPDVASAMGWNCRLHIEYEARPAVDWYIPVGTPVRSTMDGRASLYAISVPNAFDYYGVDREPYLGNPDRDRAPLSPFPGPGGGKGIFVEVVNGSFATEYAHLEIKATLTVVPVEAYEAGFSPGFDYESSFGSMRAFDDPTLIASWPVRAGDTIGYSGDSGYSEAPHLHYTVRRAGGPLLCPTTEPGFADGGWLFR